MNPRFSRLRVMRRIRGLLRSRYPFIDKMACVIIGELWFDLNCANGVEVKQLTDDVWQRRPFESEEGFLANEGVYVWNIGRPYFNSFARYFVIWEDNEIFPWNDEGSYLDIFFSEWREEKDVDQGTVAIRWSEFLQKRRENGLSVPEPVMVAELRRDVNVGNKEIRYSWTFYTSSGALPPYSASARRRRKRLTQKALEQYMAQEGFEANGEMSV